MVNVIGTANELGYINISDGTLIEIDQLKNYPDEQTVLITQEARASPWRPCPVWHPVCTVSIH